MSSAAPVHVPVLLDRVTDLLGPACAADGAVLVDATLGLAGHSLALLTAHPGLRLVGLDRDPDARAEATRRLEAAGVADRATVVPAVFDEMPDVLDRLGLAEVQAVLFDLGVSSLQLDTNERGFSYAADAPLDMRMDPTGDLTAAEIVNEWDEREIAQLLRGYGEERFSRQIARAIVRRRAREPFARTGDLVDVIKAAIPTPSRFGQGHPAKRSFQALRIAVNDELESLSEGLDHALELLAPEGRMAVISFHSLEDRIVKRFIRNQARGCTCPPDFPICVCGHEPLLRTLTARAVVPSVDERCVNPRSASAKLRAAERTQA